MPIRSQWMPRCIAVVLAGGEGRRLLPLTGQRSKPAVPFGGRYRIIDFVLSNLVNSGFERIFVLTQYKAQSLLEHLHRAWIHLRGRDSFVTAVPAQMQSGQSWYSGTANAIHQNLDLLQRSRHDFVAVFGSDHVYKMNVAQLVDFHVRHEADVTVSCIPMDRNDASAFGVVEVDRLHRIRGFAEKPTDPVPLPDDPTRSLVSMGNYLFRADILRELLQQDARDPASTHDFGRDILPAILGGARVLAYDFRRNRIPHEREDERGYWRDIGTIEAYFEANLDLKNVQPHLNLYNPDWPIHTASFVDPPVKFAFDEMGRRGMALQSIVSGGSILAGGYVKDSVLGRNVFIDAGAEVIESILHDNVSVGPGALLRRCIVDKNAEIPAGAQLVSGALPRDTHVFKAEKDIIVIPRSHEPPERRARAD